jgi:GT2 family glycosyltransferase
LIINDDTEFEPDFLERALRILEHHPKSLLLAQNHSQTSGELLNRGIHADWKRLRFEHSKGPEDTNCLSTRGLFLRLEDFCRIGGFHPRLLPHFTSDYEFTIRAHRNGYRLFTDPSLRLWVNKETTWNRRVGDEPFFASMIRLFSKKSPSNPIVWTFFIALACPWKWKLMSWGRVWVGAAVQIWRKLSPFQKARRKDDGPRTGERKRSVYSL